jgi:hypothetical protein
MAPGCARRSQPRLPFCNRLPRQITNLSFEIADRPEASRSPGSTSPRRALKLRRIFDLSFEIADHPVKLSRSQSPATQPPCSLRLRIGLFPSLCQDQQQCLNVARSITTCTVVIRSSAWRSFASFVTIRAATLTAATPRADLPAR